MLLTACRFHVLAGRLQGAGDAAAAALRRVLYYSEQLSLDYNSTSLDVINEHFLGIGEVSAWV